MKPFFTITVFFAFQICFSQVDTTAQIAIADSGKHAFKEQTKKDTADYSTAYRILSDQVKLNPQNAELRYFLGYTIDRLNADDGKTMSLLKKEMTIQASEQFEEVNRLEPVYKGEHYLLDPYAKLTSIWGSLAQAYLNRKLPDSARWAFMEGRKRGGFTDPFLELNKQLLNSCGKNAILITYGDHITIPIWYLQTIENFRTDITVVDANLINTAWYPKYLKSERSLQMGIEDAAIDTIDYMLWEPQYVRAVNPKDTTQMFSWELRPTYMDQYILKGDRMLLDIIQQNFYNRPVYFSLSSDSSYNLFLSPYLADEGLVNRVTDKIVNYEDDTFNVSDNLYNYNIINIHKNDIIKSRDAITVLNNFRWAFLYNVYHLASNGNYNKAKELIKQMTDNFSKEKLPFPSEEAEKYFTGYLSQIDEAYR